jgi:hypothetical protein
MVLMMLLGYAALAAKTAFDIEGLREPEHGSMARQPNVSTKYILIIDVHGVFLKTGFSQLPTIDSVICVHADLAARDYVRCRHADAE